MARPLRIEYPDAWYHVMNRGRRGENIFSDKTDFEIFLGILQESSELFGCRVAAFCLMSNHYHLLLQTPLGNLSRVMRHVNGLYTQRYNRRQKVDGQLFRGRYKSLLVEEDSHLVELLRYIHRNPVRAHICKSVSDYRWSSHHVYVSTAKKWDWLYTEFMLKMFSETLGKAITEYEKFVQREESEEIIDFFKKKNFPSILGSRNFVELVKAKYYRKKKHDEVPQSKDLAPTIIEIKKVVGLCYKIDIKELEEVTRGQEKEPRNVAIYLARKHSGLSLAEIGKEFGCIKYSTVSNVVRRIENKLAENNQLSKMITLIRGKLSLEHRKNCPLFAPFSKRETL
jgi:REP element-mobilizing transposase RayT